MFAGLPEIIIILVVLAVFFGAGKLPEVMGALGHTAKHFKEGKDAFEAGLKDTPPDEGSSDS